jgi:predicted XRE-type DNA-binding protein
MKKNRMKSQSLKEVAAEWGVDYQTFLIKSSLIDTIKIYCKGHSISQRCLAKLVPGLTQDRVSKIFSGQVGHMTIDKLISILSALKIRITMTAKAA